MKEWNHQYSGTVPLVTGDRKYSQDFVRDHRAMQDRIGQLLADIIDSVPILISGGVVTQGAGLNLNITEGFGYAKHEVDIPDDFSTHPPGIIQEDLSSIRVYWAAQTNINASSSNCSIFSTVDDGSTINYVKMRYLETDGNTRARAKASGTYSYEILPEFDLQVNSSAPTDYDIELARFTSNAGVYTIITSGLARTLFLPTGSIIPFGASSVPDGWVLCDATALNRLADAKLFAIIGTTWGVGDGSTTFNVPDLQGAFLRGTGSHGSETMADGNPFAGPAVGVYEEDQLQGHLMGSGGVAIGTQNNMNDIGAVETARINAAIKLSIITDGVNGTPRDGDETRPFAAGIKYIIKR